MSVDDAGASLKYSSNAVCRHYVMTYHRAVVAGIKARVEICLVVKADLLSEQPTVIGVMCVVMKPCVRNDHTTVTSAM